MNNRQEQQEIDNEATLWDYNQEAFGGSVEGPEWIPSNEEMMEMLGHEHEKYGHTDIVEHCPLCNSDEPNWVGYEGRIEVVRRHKMPEHTIVKSRSKGNDSWLVICSCGRSWQSWRWLAEEDFNEHSIPLICNCLSHDIRDESDICPNAV